MDSENILKVAANALNSKKAKDINCIKIDGLTLLTSYFLLCTATSNTHVRALADEVEEKLKESGVTPHHIEGKTSGWLVLDYSSVIVHIFTPKEREFYALDKMWSDGEKLDLTKILDDAIGE